MRINDRRVLVAASLCATAAVMGCGGGKEQPAASSNAAPPAAPATAAAPAGQAGAAQFATCSVCHQATGLGLPNAFPPLAGSEIVNGKADAHIRIVLQGLTGPVTVKGQQFNSMMPPQGAALTDADVAAAINYERSSWGNTGAQVTAEQVAAIRAATASRTTPWTLAELKQYQ